jgi:hypothetical protein
LTGVKGDPGDQHQGGERGSETFGHGRILRPPAGHDGAISGHRDHYVNLRNDYVVLRNHYV